MKVFLDHERRLRTPWRIGFFIAGMIGIELGGALVLGVGLAALLAIGGKNLQMLATPDGQAWGLIVAGLPLAVLTLGLVWFCRRVLDRRSMRSLGLGRPRASALTGLASGVALITLPAAVLIGIGGYRFLGLSASLQTAVLVPTLLVAAFQEEIVCRGYILQNFIDIRRPTTGVVVSSAFFWLSHGLNEAVWSSSLPSINLLLAGVLLALAYRVGGDLWFPTALHFGWNLGQGVLLQLPISGVRTDGLVDLEPTGRFPAWVTGGGFGLESSAIVASIQLLAVVTFARILSKRPQSDELAVEPLRTELVSPPVLDSRPEAAGRSPWLYVAIGCAVVGAIGLVLTGTAVYYVGRSMQQWAADMRNPAAQEARARHLLGTEELPEGYPAVISISVPFLLDLVLLSDRGPGPGGRSSLGQRGFLYTRARLVLPTDREELREVVDGKRRQAPLLVREQIAVDGAVLRRGRVSAAGAAVSYAVQRGEFKYGGLVHRGLHTLLLIECPSDTIVRIGVWFASETAERGAWPRDLAGSPADETALHAFLDHFRCCE